MKHIYLLIVTCWQISQHCTHLENIFYRSEVIRKTALITNQDQVCGSCYQTETPAVTFAARSCSVWGENFAPPQIFSLAAYTNTCRVQVINSLSLLFLWYSPCLSVCPSSCALSIKTNPLLFWLKNAMHSTWYDQNIWTSLFNCFHRLMFCVCACVCMSLFMYMHMHVYMCVM